MFQKQQTANDLQKARAAYLSILMIDLNGPDIEAVDEVKALILESVNAWKNYKKRIPSRSTEV